MYFLKERRVLIKMENKAYHTKVVHADSDIGLSVPFYQLELVRDYTIKFEKMHTIGEAAQICHRVLDKSPVEQMVCLHLNSSLEVVGAERIAIGQLESVTAWMREVFRGAILASVPRVLLSHNHPSGNPTASEADIGYTLAAMSASNIIGIEIVDHIVVSPNGSHYSIFEHKERLEERLRKDSHSKDFEDLVSKFVPNQVQKFIGNLINGFNPLLLKP